ncbi:MAG: ABC transporter ATP-binding protein [Rubellimicrobium sp.]|nr:ABC transporter ATP-binding protein [Rubellimicrobium sp.]
MTAPVLEIDRVTRRFGAILANDAISMTLGKGEIVALLGENGAGKTTLMSILFGHYTPDEGRILIDGQELPPGRPRAAIRAGVGMVHQHFSLAPNLTVLENVMTGTESLWSTHSRTAAARARLLGIAARFGLVVDPEARLGDLSVGEQQRVEILKALYNDARILILDEPTAVLTKPEAERLFVTLREMARQGLSLIFISHKLDEVMAAADRIVVLRGGRVVAERRPDQTDKAELAELMVGRRVVRPRRDPATPGQVVLEMRGVVLREAGVDRLRGIDLSLREGEVLGIIGVAGNGQTHLARILSGTVRRSGGEMVLFGRPAGHPDVAGVVAMGIGRIPEDRHKEGAIGEMAVWENVVLEQIDAPGLARRGIVNRKEGVALARRIIEEFDVRGAQPGTRTRLLSGGNMQKLILGRNLDRHPRILLAAQPARGLDEGAVAAVHARILAARKAGTAVLLISEDLDEVMALADRVQAMVGGRLSPEVDADHVDARALGLMMAGDWSAATEAAHAS